MQSITSAHKTLIRLPQVRQFVGLSRSEIYRRLSLGQFPRPVPLGERAVAWDLDEVQEYVRQKIAGRQAAQILRLAASGMPAESIASAERLSLEHVLRVRGEARDGERT
jgi:prophage regulatory protein